LSYGRLKPRDLAQGFGCRKGLRHRRRPGPASAPVSLGRPASRSAARTTAQCPTGTGSTSPAAPPPPRCRPGAGRRAWHTSRRNAPAAAGPAPPGQ